METVIEIVPLNMEESSEEEQHLCGICYEGFDSEESLEIHYRICSEKMPFACGTCQLTFEHEEEMLQHQTNEHQDEMEGIITDPDPPEESNEMDQGNDEYKPFVCNVCCEAFQSIELLNEHTSVHVESKGMTCNTCSSEFTNLYAYLKHRITHEIEETNQGDGKMSHHKVKETNPGDGKLSHQKVKEANISIGMSYCCHMCSKNFSTRYGLDQHEKSHSKDHQCNVCRRPFPTKSRLTKHMQIHIANRPYKCHKCDQGFSARHTLIEHLQLHEEEEDYHSCAICKKLFHQKSSLDKHMRTHQEISGDNVIKHVCVCSKEFQSRRDWDQHLKTGDCTRHECTLCSKSFSCESELKQHMAIHIGNRSYKCHRCNKAFMRKAHLQSHMFVHNAVQHSCTICKKTFKQKFRLLIHMKTHNNEDRAETLHKCKRCDMVFMSSEYLAAHTLEHPKNHCSCPLCLSIFSKICQLKDHMLQAHNIEKPTVNAESEDSTNNYTKKIQLDEKETNFPCGYCDETFTLESHLIEHLEETHSALKPLKNYWAPGCNKHIAQQYGKKKNYMCIYEDCGNSYQFQYEWKLHMKYHKEKGDDHGFHSCPYCEKQFIHMFNFDAHVQNHIDENPYQCELCNDVFSAQAELDVHKAKHINEEKYNCDQCDKVYKREWDLRNHILGQHSLVEPVPVPKYSCSRCRETFTAKADMIVHLEKHRSEDMYYTCKTCYKVYNSKDNFDSHQLTCISSHRCTRCLKIFTSKTEYAQHLSTHFLEMVITLAWNATKYSVTNILTSNTY